MSARCKKRLVSTSIFALLAPFCVIPSPAFAYIGPGAGLGAIAVAVGLMLGAVLLVGGFVWYPLKRLLRNRKRAQATQPRETKNE